MRKNSAALTKANIAVLTGTMSDFNFLTDFNYQNNSRHTCFVPDFASVYSSLIYAVYLDKNNSNVSVYKDGSLYFEDNKSYPTPTWDASSAISMNIFATAPINTNQMFIGNIYECQIKNEGALVRNFIPALDPSGRPCMFDTVSQKPFYNSGTGEFQYALASQVSPPLS